MISKNNLEEILVKYPELIEPGLVSRGRHVDLYGQEVDILFEDKSGKRLAVQVLAAPIRGEHVGEMVSYQNAILTGEALDISVMLVADKVPPHLQTAFRHNGVTWKEIPGFKIKEHLDKRNDAGMLGPPE
ncbi:MAG: hypothetical protein DRP85_05800 [Candidatus Makaraimicrobium thalassicum]|nr:MAG: hypothetical protein DRP85_05800 [Candidatus Omnitrophota bacterium]